MRRARWKRKNVRRVGPHVCGPPAAGGGWLAVPRGSQGRRRPALGEASSPGRYRDTPCLSPRCRSRSREEPGSAWRSGRRGKRSCSNAILHPDALRTIRHGTAASTSQKTQACPKGRPNRSRHRYAVPRARGGQLHRSAAKSALFFWTVHGPFSFRQDRKENGGCIAQLASQLNPPGGRLPPLRRPPPGERKKAAGHPGQPPRGLSLRQKSLEDPVLRLLRRQAQGLQL